MDERSITELLRLPEKNADCGSIRDSFRVQTVSRD
jgi:hypothetical protein